MVSTDYTAPAAVTQTPPIVGELQRLFDSLDDSRLVGELIGPTRRGPKGHSVEAIWRAFVTKHHMGLPTTRALIGTLENNPWIAEACGFDWPNIPHEATFSRFFKRLSTPKFLPRVKDVSRSLVRRCYDELPGFGKRVASDTTTLKGWTNGGKPVKSDSDAGWLVKKNTHGKNNYVFGFNLHLLTDATDYELPIAATVSPGNAHDVTRATNVLSEARFTMGGGFRPDHIMADAGYSSQKFLPLIREQYWANPVVEPNKRHKKLVRKTEKTTAWRPLYSQRQGVE